MVVNANHCPTAIFVKPPPAAPANAKLARSLQARFGGRFDRPTSTPAAWKAGEEYDENA